MDLSIIVTTFNRAETLSRILQSIMEADTPENVEYEIIVVDNNSTDDTASVIRRTSETDPRVVYLFEEKKGVANARNLGIKKARGDILIIADDDVIVDRNWIRAYWRLFTENKDVHVAQGKILLEEQLGKLSPWLELEGLSLLPYFDPGENVVFIDDLIGCNTAFRKEVFEQYGGFSPFLGAGTAGGFGEDTELATRLRNCGLKIHYQPEAVVYHVVDKERTTKTYWLQRRYRHGYTVATTDVLVNWGDTRRIRSAGKLAEHYLKYTLARILGNERRALRAERKIASLRGLLDGTRDAMKRRRRLCKGRQKLTACIIAQNSALCIARVLGSVEDFCDEIIVVDGGSTDNTPEIVKSFKKVKYYLRPWTGSYTQQKNWAFNQAEGDWILSLDSDEAVGVNMKNRILKLMKNSRYSSYMFPRYWLISESPCSYVYAEKLYPDYQQRLFRNIPKHHYACDRVLHHRFPEGVQGKGKKVKDTHFFHFNFIYYDRPAREQEVRDQAKMEPQTAHINRNQYLFEDHPYEIRKCREKLWRPPDS